MHTVGHQIEYEENYTQHMSDIVGLERLFILSWFPLSVQNCWLQCDFVATMPGLIAGYHNRDELVYTSCLYPFYTDTLHHLLSFLLATFDLDSFLLRLCCSRFLPDVMIFVYCEMYTAILNGQHKRNILHIKAWNQQSSNKEWRRQGIHSECLSKWRDSFAFIPTMYISTYSFCWEKQNTC